MAFYTWSGLEQHSGTTQIIRAINVLYALTGCFDAPGGEYAGPWLCAAYSDRGLDGISAAFHGWPR